MSKEKENHYLHPWTQKALKYMLFKIVGFLLGAVTLLPSCEKAISFKPHNAEALAVVEASIENGKYPTVFLSQSQNYFSRISPGQLDSSFIHGANITVSNGT